MFRLLLPVLLLFFASVYSWAACNYSSSGFSPLLDVSPNNSCKADPNWGASLPMCSSFAACTGGVIQGVGRLSGRFYYDCFIPWGTSNACNGGDFGTTTFRESQTRCYYECSTQCEADSLKGCPEGKVWSSDYCDCVDSPPPPRDTVWHCQNAGGAEPGGFGSAPVAKLFKCYSGTCHNTRDVAGTCQDWGFCPDGVSDCEIPDSLGHPPCGRSGSQFITSARCVYACADGKDLSCTPVSTGYVAGNIYAGECPKSPPAACRPQSSSSGASSSPSSSPSGLSSSTDWRDTINPENGQQLDYTRILAAILDTLHHANVQRDFVLELENNMSLDLDNISNFSEYNYQQLVNLNGKGTAINTALGDINTSIGGSNTALSGISSTLSGIASNGVPFDASVASDVSTASDLLGAINDYLHSDSMLFNRPSDTTYNPLLRDIKDALDSASFRPSVDTSIFVRDSVFAKWWANYYSDSASSRGLVGKALSAITQNLSVADSSKKSGCGGFYGCMRVYKNMDYCSNAWGVGISDCVDGGTPFDGLWNVEAGILETVWNFMFGDSTADYTPSSIDSAVSFSPSLSAAYAGLSSASGVLDTTDVSGLLSHVLQLVDSAQRARNDSVKVQPDSLWLDSSDAAQYVSNILFPGGTSTDCFICHADLGTFGGLSDTSLSIHIDFSNFGGFDWCALVRAVVKIATLVVCISLTLGSWMAAFGYNPKNDG